MSLLIETIRFENGHASLLPYHQMRVDESSRLLLNGTTAPKLTDHLLVPTDFQTGVVKCRVIYSETIQKVEWISYHLKWIDSLVMVQNNLIRYEHKFANREEINKLTSALASGEEVLIIRNGLVTDTSFTNVAFLKGTIWYTPANPLLFGTRLSYLLELGVLKKANIYEKDLSHYQKIRLFNAMIPWEEAIEINIQNIHESKEEPH